MPTMQQIKKKFESIVAQADRELDKFKEELAQNPVHAFIWGEDAMKAAAQKQVAGYYLASIQGWEDKRASHAGEELPETEEEAVTRLYNFIVKTAIDKARFTNQSTSFMSNNMARFEAAFYAELASDWELFY
jgi:hypothetical protein